MVLWVIHRWRCGRCGRADILLQARPWAGGSTGESTRWRSGRRAPSLRTPLATPRGRACHRSTRLLLASTPYRTPPTNAPAVCIACSCVPLHSGARRPACMQHKQTAAHRCRSSRCGQSQHRPASAWACGRVTTLVSGSAPSKNSRLGLPPSNGACQHLPRGGVNTFEHLYGCGVNR